MIVFENAFLKLIFFELKKLCILRIISLKDMNYDDLKITTMNIYPSIPIL